MEACHRAGCACLSPVALKSAARCALRTLSDPAPDGTATPLPPLLPTFAPLSTTFQPPHPCEARRHQCWLHGYMKSFLDLEIGKVFSGALLTRVVTVDY